MTLQNHRALAIRWMQEVWNERSDAALEELLDPQVVGYFEGVGEIGAEEFRAARNFMIGIFPDLRITVEDQVAEGENVVVRWRAQATHLGNSDGLPATGKKVDFRGLTWMTFRNGKIVRGWDAWNQGALLEELKKALAS